MKVLARVFGSIFSILLGMAFVACESKSEAEKLGELLLSLTEDQNANSIVAPPSLKLDLGQVVNDGGIPISSRPGKCGNGVIESGEHCDLGAMEQRDCASIGGLGGNLICGEDCKLDIRNCLTPAIGDELDGLAETCKCNCDNTPCRGGCIPTSVNGQSECRFQCDNDCICNCEGKLENHIEECNLMVFCSVDQNGNPVCTANMDECDTISIIGPGIATKILKSGISSGHN